MIRPRKIPPFTKIVLPTDIERILLEMFSWANQSYIETLKTIKAGEYVAFCVDELDPTEYGAVKDYFLNGSISHDKMHLDMFWKHHSPKPQITEQFDWAFEHLLLWAAEYLHNKPRKEKEFLANFLDGFYREPKEVVYAPIYRLSRNNSTSAEAVDFSQHLSLVELDFIERQGIKFQAYSLGRQNNFPPGFSDVLPSLFLKIERPINSGKETGKEINVGINCFKVMMCGLFGVDVDLPFYFTGRKWPWHPWIYENGQFESSYPHDADFKNITDWDMRLIKKYWNSVGQNTLKQYRITALRLRQAKSRKDLQERVVDLAIALEGLFSDDSELTFKYSAITASLVESDPQKKFEIYRRLKSFYGLRSKIVHGKLVEKEKDWNNLKRDELEKRLKEIETYIRKLLKLHLLNPSLRDNNELVKIMMGVFSDLVLEMIP